MTTVFILTNLTGDTRTYTDGTTLGSYGQTSVTSLVDGMSNDAYYGRLSISPNPFTTTSTTSSNCESVTGSSGCDVVTMPPPLGCIDGLKDGSGSVQHRHPPHCRPGGSPYGTVTPTQHAAPLSSMQVPAIPAVGQYPANFPGR